MTTAHPIATGLAGHPWLAQVHAANAGVLLLLNSAGVEALRRSGRQALLEQLQAQLDAQSIDAPRHWRLLDVALPEVTTSLIDATLAQARPERPTVLSEQQQQGHWSIALQLPLELLQFDGHFARAPVLAGVVQVGWALALAATRLGTSVHCREMEALKFQHLLHPADRVELRLHLDAEAVDATHGKLHFGYYLDGAHCSSGRLLVRRRHD